MVIEIFLVETMANSEDYIDVAIVREMLNKRPFSVC
jgi:hypothetical protein